MPLRRTFSTVKLSNRVAVAALKIERMGHAMAAYASGAAFDHHDRASAAPTLTGSTAAGQWAVAMADLTVELHANFTDVEAMIAAIAASAVKLLPGVTAAGVVRIGRDAVLTCLNATNPQVLQMVQAEHRTGHGPCRDVLLPGRSGEDRGR